MHELITTKISSILKNKPDPLGVRKSTARLIISPRFVFIDPEKLEAFAGLLSKRINKHELLNASQFGSLGLSPQLVFLEDVVNFCFWSKMGEPKWKMEYPKGNFVGGWNGLSACFGRALSEGIPILNPDYLIGLTIGQIQKIFRGANGTQIPLLFRRLENLKEAGLILKTRFAGSFENLISEAEFDAPRIAGLIIKHFPSFADRAIFKGKPVFFYKRAQICAYDLSMLPNLKIKNLDQLTAFADYKLPQLLRAGGVLKYTPELAGRIDKMELIPAGSREELEIRAATIWACELISNKLGEAPVVIDNALWLWAQEKDKTVKMPPYHRTLSIYY